MVEQIGMVIGFDWVTAFSVVSLQKRPVHASRTKLQNAVCTEKQKPNDKNFLSVKHTAILGHDCSRPSSKECLLVMILATVIVTTVYTRRASTEALRKMTDRWANRPRKYASKNKLASYPSMWEGMLSKKNLQMLMCKKRCSSCRGLV